MRKILQTTKKVIQVTINNILVNFTLAKFAGALFTITMVALIKFSISGNFHISYSDF